MNANPYLLPTPAEHIAKALPTWLKNATVAQRDEFQQRLHKSRASRAKALAIAQRLEQPVDFCRPLLAKALQDEYNLDLDLDQHQLVELQHYAHFQRPLLKNPPRSLLAAALSNFAEDAQFERDSAILPAGSLVHYWNSYDPGKVVHISPAQFAATCRRLDLGARYQAHVDHIYPPLPTLGQPADSLRDWARAGLGASLADELRTQVQRARLQRCLSEEDAVLVEQLLAGQTPRWDGYAVQVCQLYLAATWTSLGIPLHRATVLRQGDNPASPHLVYLPGDPDRPLWRYARLSDFEHWLRPRLNSAEQCQQWALLAPIDSRKALAEQLYHRLNPLPLLAASDEDRVHNPDADLGARAISQEHSLAQWLYLEVRNQVTAYAGACVVSTGQADRVRHAQRMARWQTLGFDALNIGALVVPGLDVLMAAVMAGQLLGEVFEGLDDWTHGQTEEALQQLFEVAATVAQAAVLAPLHSAFVESLQPVLDTQGQARLWSPRQALRNLGPEVEGVGDEALEQARLACGLSEAAVHRLQVERLPLPAALLECLADVRAGASVADPVAVVVTPLQRDFPRLSPHAAQEIQAQANDRERQRLGLGQVPLRLAELARMALRERQLNRALLGLVIPGMASADSARLAAGLVADGAPLFEQAVANRAVAARLIGQQRAPAWLRPPTRQANGLIGYELSGRPGNLRRQDRLARLYPQADEDQLQRLRQELEPAVDLNLGLRELEYRRLQATLVDWTESPDLIVDENGNQEPVQAQSRANAAQLILAAWRREAPTMQSARNRGRGHELDLSEYRIGRLPALNLRMNHVYSLSLAGTGQVEDPSAFLAAFPRLEALELQDNQLSRIPVQVGLLSELNVLALDENRLQGSDHLFDGLVNLNDLQILTLRNNPLQTPPAAMAVLGGLRSLQDLSLASTDTVLDARALDQLARLPDLNNLWLSDNHLVLSAESLQALARMPRLDLLNLDGNPLGEHLDLASLTQLRTLYLRDCDLTQWPAGLSELINAPARRLAFVNLEENPLQEVPVLQPGPFFERPAGHRQRLNISAEHLTPQSLEHLRQVNILPTWANDQADWLSGACGEVRQQVAALRALPQARYFLQALEHIEDTEQYRHDPGSGRRRAQQLISDISAPVPGDDGQGLEHLRRQVFDIGEEEMTTCVDGFALIFNRFETRVLIYRVAGSVIMPEQAMTPLLNLSRQLYRADRLDLTAVAIMQARMVRRAALFPQAIGRHAEPGELALVTALVERGAPPLDPLDDATLEELANLPDEIEMCLRLRMELAEALDLPPQPTDMRYHQPLTDSLRERIRDHVRSLDTDSRWVQWAIAQDWWCDLLERRYASRLEALREHWYAGHEYLWELGRPSPEIGSVATDVMAVLQAQYPQYTWLREGMPQVLALTPVELDGAIQRLSAGERAARNQLLAVLSQELLDDSRQ
ncbi:MAG: NEL-type E3 ubiquitin ligase domain-containing protein [Pseudomonas sp.]|nr:NEL-type E3 ubiquitin ligase domain-containing protein [Pseudomonas sp.]